MSRMLKIHQYKKHPLIQITDGRHPYAAEENTKGWVERGSIEASPDAIADVLTVVPSTVLDEIERKGWCQLDHFQIQEAWRSRWVKR